MSIDRGYGIATSSVLADSYDLDALIADTEAAKAAALAAQTAAETAKTAAELAETNAETAETNAETAETNAETAETGATTQAALATTNGAAQVTLATAQVALATTQAGLATTNGAAQVTLATTQATNASTSATNAATSETNAGTSATNAAASATTATTQATTATTQATAAAASATAAAASADTFDDTYLGAKSSDPTVDNDGDALTAGDLYYNTTSSELKYYNGSAWTAIVTYTHPNHSGDVVSSGDGAMTIQVDAVDIAMLSATGTASSSTFLRGDNAWTAVDALPSQTGHAGKYLTTDASTASWATLDTDANTTTKGLYEHAHTINTAYSITSTNNAMSAGPVVIGSSGSVTVPATSVWTIV